MTRPVIAWAQLSLELHLYVWFDRYMQTATPAESKKANLENSGSEFDKAVLQRLRVLQKVCLDIVFEPNIEEMMQHVTDWVADALEAEICSLFLRDEADPEWLVLRAAKGYPPNLLNSRTHRVGEGITGFIVQEKQAVLLNGNANVAAHPAWKGRLDMRRNGRCETFLGYPIYFRKDAALGTLKVENKTPTPAGSSRGFTDEDQLVLETICGVLAMQLKAEESKKEQWRVENIARFFHTFRSPLFTVRVMCQRIGNLLDLSECGKPVPDLAERIRVAYAEALRFEQLVNNSAFWTRNQASPKIRDVTLAQLAGDIIHQYGEYAKFKNVTLTFLPPPEATERRRTDPGLFILILANLLQNAIEYGGGVVTVILELNSSGYTLEVRDNGPGMTLEEKAKATQPYYRGPASNMKDGLGLGLSVCEKATRLLQGKLDFFDQPREGLIVKVAIPDSKENKSKLMNNEMTTPEPQVKPAVILIEDRDGHQFFLVEILESMGFEVKLCSTFTEVCALVPSLSVAPKGIMLDLQIPYDPAKRSDLATGRDCGLWLRKQSLTSTVPIIADSAFPEDPRIAGWCDIIGATFLSKNDATPQDYERVIRDNFK